jgi:serine protease AprX
MGRRAESRPSFRRRTTVASSVAVAATLVVSAFAPTGYAVPPGQAKKNSTTTTTTVVTTTTLPPAPPAAPTPPPTTPPTAPTPPPPATASSSLPLGSMHRVVDQIGARALWAQGFTGEGVTVAVLDTGVAPVPALSDPDKVVAMVDLSAEAGMPDAEYLDTYGHGTHMTGIIAGRTPGADPALATQHPEWFLGVAPDAEIVSVKLAGASGAVDPSQVIAGIEWVVEHKDELSIDVLNLSYGTDSTQSYLNDPMAYAVEQAWDAGIVVVVAAGNDGRGTQRLGNPAIDPFVIAVAAAQPRNNGNWKVPSWGTSGDGVRNPDLAAPGTSVHSLQAPGSRISEDNPSAVEPNGLFRGSGSSQAAAVVSGAAALLLDARPDLTPDQVKALLRGTADPFSNGQARFQGAGLLDLDEALTAAVPANAAQTHARSTGDGSLQASRGSSFVVVNGEQLTGETTVLGAPWDGRSWRGDTWTDGAWDGRSWRSSTWRGIAWEDAQWTGRSWRGADWNGALWTSEAWSAGTWSGAEWTAATWTGRSWRDTAWDGRSWRDAAWDGRSWRDGSWDGRSWRDANWDGRSWRDADWDGRSWRIGSWS